MSNLVLAEFPLKVPTSTYIARCGERTKDVARDVVGGYAFQTADVSPSILSTDWNSGTYRVEVININSYGVYESSRDKIKRQQKNQLSFIVKED